MSTGATHLLTAVEDAPARHLTGGLELLLFGLAGLLTIAVVSIFAFAVLRHANRDSQGRSPGGDDDRGAA